MSKAVISFWFRIYQETVDAAREQRNAYPATDYPRVFSGIIPLIVFGNQITAPVIQGDPRLVGSRNVLVDIGVVELQPVIETYPVASTAVPYPPSFIGVECREDGNFIVVRLQTKDFPDVSQLHFRNETVAPTGPPANLLETDFHIVDASAAYNAIPQSYGVTSNAVNVTADEWHHIILSYDITNPISVHGVHRDESDGTDIQGVNSHNWMWYALDDVNYDETDLPAHWVYGGPSNAILSEDSTDACAAPWHEIDPAAGPFHRYFPGGVDGPASYVCPASPIPAEVIDIPSLATYQSGDGPQKPEHHIDMAELQIFMNVTLNTSVPANRRAFIDIVDEMTLGPVDPTTTEELLGRRPDILLHKTGNWKQGKNTGTLGLDEADEIIEAGQFSPTGTIKKVTPDPSIQA